MSKYILTLALLAFIPDNALACSQAKILLGKNINSSSLIEHIEKEDLAPKKEVNRVNTRANVICPSLTEEDIAVITVVNNKISTIDIKSSTSEGSILRNLEKEWGNAVRKPNPKQSHVKTFQNIWVDEGNMIFYSNANNQERVVLSDSSAQKKITKVRTDNEITRKGGSR